jgi:hypothetical protein
LPPVRERVEQAATTARRRPVPTAVTWSWPCWCCAAPGKDVAGRLTEQVTQGEHQVGLVLANSAAAGQCLCGGRLHRRHPVLVGDRGVYLGADPSTRMPAVPAVRRPGPARGWDDPEFHAALNPRRVESHDGVAGGVAYDPTPGGRAGHGRPVRASVRVAVADGWHHD